MKKLLLWAAAFFAVAGPWTGRAEAEDIATLDGTKYENVRDIILKPTGLYFVYGTESSLRSALVPYAKLPPEVKEKYHYDPYEMGLKAARGNQPLALTKKLAFSLDQLEAAKAKAASEKKLLGFIMVWDNFFRPVSPMGEGSESALADFYDVFHDSVVLVFVRHESELGNVPDAVKKGFFGPEEGGFAPNMAVVTPDCAEFVCEIPYGGKNGTGMDREKIFRQKIEVMKKFCRAHPL